MAQRSTTWQASVAGPDSVGSALRTSVGDPRHAATVAVLVLATRTDVAADDVLAACEEARTAGAGSIRLWPVLAGPGSVKAMNELDELLDQHPALADAALLVTGPADSPADLAGALLAWVAVKGDGPPGVFSELTDLAGRACRWVSLAGASVPRPEPVTRVAGDEGDPGSAGSAAAIVAAAGSAQEELRAAALADLLAVAVSAATERLKVALSALDLSRVLAADAELTEALAAVAGSWPGVLAQRSEVVAREQLSRWSAADSATLGAARELLATRHQREDSPPRPPARAQLIAEFGAAAARGGLTRLFGRRRLAELAQAASAAATAQVRAELDSAIRLAEQACAAHCLGLVASYEQAALARGEESELVATARATADWREAVRQVLQPAAEASAPESDASSRRTWASGPPRARRYLAGPGDLIGDGAWAAGCADQTAVLADAEAALVLTAHHAQTAAGLSGGRSSRGSRGGAEDLR